MKKTAFLFSGGGAQYPGMAQDICQAHREAAAVFEQANETLGRDIAALTFSADSDALNLTHNTQPCMLTTEIAMLRVLEASGVSAAITAGFSLGEWAALVAAGVLPFERALPLVQLRADAMQRAVPAGEGGMAVILGKTAEEVAALCARVAGVSPSNYNCPGQITVAGVIRGIQALLEITQREGVTAKQLAVSIPSHCALMKPAADELEAAIRDVAFCAPRHPIVMNATGEATADVDVIKANLIKQLTMPVLFEQSVRYMLGSGVDTFIEIGPGKVLSGLVKKTAKASGRDVTVLRTENLETLRAGLADITK